LTDKTTNNPVVVRDTTDRYMSKYSFCIFLQLYLCLGQFYALHFMTGLLIDAQLML